MDRIRCIEVFAEVARAHSFTAAAERLNMSRASATKHVRALEDCLGAQLLLRTTARVRLTDAGTALLEQAGTLPDWFVELGTRVRGSVTDPRGTLRIGTPPAFGAFLVRAAAAFTENKPDVHVALLLDDGRADLLAEGLDISLRIAPALSDSSHVAQLLARVPQLLVASPAYLTAKGTPSGIRALKQHNCLLHTLKAPRAVWRFSGAGGETSVRVAGTVSANFGEAMRQASIAGHGISMHPTYMVEGDIAAGRLVAVLPQFEPTRLAIYAVTPSQARIPNRVQTFIGFLKTWFGKGVP